MVPLPCRITGLSKPVGVTLGDDDVDVMHETVDCGVRGAGQAQPARSVLRDDRRYVS